MWQGKTYKYTADPQQKLSASGVYLPEEKQNSQYLDAYNDLNEDGILQEVELLTSLHKKTLSRFHFGVALCTFARRGFKPFGDGAFKGFVALSGRVLLLLVLYACTHKLLLAAAIYCVLHLFVLLIGNRIRKKNEQKLWEIDERSGVLFAFYKAYRYGKYDIQSGMLYFDHNSVWISDSGSVCARMRQDVSHIDIYQLGKVDEQKEYYQRIYDHTAQNTVNFSEKIASLAFNEKFGIISQKGWERDCMKLFSPHTQLTLLKSPVIANFSQLSIANGKLSGKTKYSVAQPSPIFVFTKKPLIRYFQGVDEYCTAFKEMGDKVYKELKQIDVLLGSDM